MFRALAAPALLLKPVHRTGEPLDLGLERLEVLALPLLHPVPPGRFALHSPAFAEITLPFCVCPGHALCYAEIVTIGQRYAFYP